MKNIVKKREMTGFDYVVRKIGVVVFALFVMTILFAIPYIQQMTLKNQELSLKLNEIKQENITLKNNLGEYMDESEITLLLK